MRMRSSERIKVNALHIVFRKFGDVEMGRDLDESTVAHSDTIINWPIKSDLENDFQVGITMNV